MTEEIQIADIAKELSRQWEMQEAAHQVRASLFNLIFYSDEENSYLKSFVETIVEKFPCRIILIQSNKEPSQNYVRVSVSSHVKGNIACDQINIEVSQSQLKRVPFIIYPHLLSDLPIYFLWGKDPCEENLIFSELQKIAKKMIFHSQDLIAFSHNFSKKRNYEISDVNWVSTRGWRAALASTFDNPEKLTHLRDAHLIHISYNKGNGHSENQAIYLQAWIAGLLEWDFKKRNLQITGVVSNIKKPLSN